MSVGDPTLVRQRQAKCKLAGHSNGQSHALGLINRADAVTVNGGFAQHILQSHQNAELQGLAIDWSAVFDIKCLR